MRVISHLPLAILLACCAAFAAEPGPNAARSVHLAWAGRDVEWFTLEMTVRESTPGSYFMACGWNTGYFGIQELGADRKVAIFSVWDPTRGDNPRAVRPEDRVELLYRDPDVRIRRFGGEGTGGQCMLDFDWQLGKAYRFAVHAEPQADKTAYTGYLRGPGDASWRKLVVFRTRTGGQKLRGLYSFVEDFRRDTASIQQRRRAEYASVWIKPSDGAWKVVNEARFTASNSPRESQGNIDAGFADGRWRLATGGKIEPEHPVGSRLPGENLPSEPPAIVRELTAESTSPSEKADQK